MTPAEDRRVLKATYRGYTDSRLQHIVNARSAPAPARAAAEAVLKDRQRARGNR